MIWIGFRFAVREPTRLALSAGGIACAVVLTVFLAGVYRGSVRGSLSYIAEADADVWVGRRGSWNLMRASGLLPASIGRRLLEVKGVTTAEPILAALLPAEVNGLRRTLLVVGLDSGAVAGRPKRVVEGQGLPGSGEIVIDRAFARRAHVGVGDTVALAGHALVIAGVTDETNLLVTQYAFVARRDLLAAVGLGDMATFFLVRGTGPPPQLAARIEDRVSGVAAYDRTTFLANNLDELETGFLPILWAIALLGLVVGGSVVAIMTYAAVLEKRGDYVLLAAIGAGRGLRFAVVLQQALLAAAVGAVAGLAILAALQAALPALVPELSLRVEPRIAAAALAGAMIMAALGATLPGRVATRFAPLEALRR
jgi:hypothetical protein